MKPSTKANGGGGGGGGGEAKRTLETSRGERDEESTVHAGGKVRVLNGCPGRVSCFPRSRAKKRTGSQVFSLGSRLLDMYALRGDGTGGRGTEAGRFHLDLDTS